MYLDLKTSLVAAPAQVTVLIVKVVTGYWVHTNLDLDMKNQNLGRQSCLILSCFAPIESMKY
jgi:hypothetical protein